MDEIRLHFGRVGDLYSGQVLVTYGPTRGMFTRAEFEGFSFPRMMAKLAEVIREHEQARVFMNRTEMNGSTYKLDDATVELLRKDPAAAISSMMPESRTVVIRDRSAFAVPPSRLLRVGHDTIAEAFGDAIYCVVDAKGQVECPGCGRWSEATANWLNCSNTSCAVRLPGKLTGMAWFVIETTELLKLNHSKYYLPRSWNPKRGWIPHQELQSLFESFQQEREQCSQSDRKE